MLEVFQCDVNLSRLELGLTRDKYSRAQLRSILNNRIATAGWNPAGSYPLQLPLQQLVDEFSERLATGAAQNVQRYFTMRGTSGFTAGGRRAVSGPMRYTQSRQRVSNEDIGALGEGIAGYYLENIEGLQFEIRPFDVSPDFIFREPSTGSVMLCEVKTSLETWPRTLVRNAMDLLEVLSKTQLIRLRQYKAYIVLVRILNPNDFELRRLQLEVL
jgi:hypothetical protein